MIEDRVKDQEVWAECLDPTHVFDEGRLQLGDVFRVGWIDGVQSLRVPYPAVRMEYLRSIGVAYRVDAPKAGRPDWSKPSPSTSEEADTHAVHGGGVQVADEPGSPKKPPKDRRGFPKPGRGA